MVKQATALVSDVQRSGAWQAVFTEEEVNGWLAVELSHRADLLPGTVSQPRVHIEADGLSVAFRYRDARYDTIVSLVVDAYLIQPNVFGLRVRRARAGLLPLPMEDVLREISRAVEQWAWVVDWRQEEGDPVAQVTIPASARRVRKRVMSLDSLLLEEGRVRIGGSTARR